MSTARTAKPTPGLLLGAEPRANLLPPEVQERAKARLVRTYLVFLVVLVLLVTIGGYAFASIRVLTAQSTLAAAQTRTAQLIEEKATYGDTIRVVSDLALADGTRLDAVSTEVLWAEVLDTIGAVLPVGSYAVAQFELSSPSPWEAPLATTGPLREPRVATIRLQIVTAGIPDVTAMYRSIETVEGLVDTSIDVTENPEGKQGYYTTITINLDAESLSGRFAEEDEAEASEGATEGEESTDEGE